MIITITAKKYAKALFDLALEEKRSEKIIDEYKGFLDLIEGNQNFYQLLYYPNKHYRDNIFIPMLEPYFSKLFLNFLKIVLKNKRYHLFFQIFNHLQILFDEHRNRTRLILISAIPLTEYKINNIQKKFEIYFSQKVIIINKVDPSIIGGFIIKLNGQQYNASLLEHFNIMENHLTKD